MFTVEVRRVGLRYLVTASRGPGLRASRAVGSALEIGMAVDDLVASLQAAAQQPAQRRAATVGYLEAEDAVIRAHWADSCPAAIAALLPARPGLAPRTAYSVLARAVRHLGLKPHTARNLRHRPIGSAS